MSYDVSYGAISSLYAGTAPAAAELNGKVSIPALPVSPAGNGPPFQYLTTWARVTLPHQKALDTELGKKLWEWCEKQVKDI
jgi:retinol dehydrogenase 12